jgi:hypothetical protein
MRERLTPFSEPPRQTFSPTARRFELEGENSEPGRDHQQRRTGGQYEHQSEGDDRTACHGHEQPTGRAGGGLL